MKGTKSEFGYKLHSRIDKEHQFGQRFDTSTAGETVCRDKGSFGAVPVASIDPTMKRSVRGKPISTKDQRRDRAISRTRSLVELPFAVIKRVFHVGFVMVTAQLQVRAKNLVAWFSCHLFNLVAVRKNQTVGDRS
jgi:IS5 family transposase